MKPVLVVGGGIGGLATATLLARGGNRVVLFERSGHLGGRGRSSEHAGGTLNIGPHAFYRAGAAARVMRELGVPVVGTEPPASGKALRGGKLSPLPISPGAFLTSDALSIPDKLAIPAYLSPFGTAPDVTVAEWLADAPDGCADFVRALIRVSSYANAPGLQSARRAQTQLRAALKGVLYLNGGWQSRVDGLEIVARDAGVEIRLNTEVDHGILHSAEGAIVLAGSPRLARHMGLPIPEFHSVRAACLDMVLDRLPCPENRFVLGLDEPYYLSEHGSIARVSSNGEAVLHVAEYLAPGAHGDEERLERLLDGAQPGWRERVLFRRFIPAIEVAGRVDEPGQRAPIERDGTWLVGDWVGEEGMLLDRTLASAQAVATAILNRASLPLPSAAGAA